MAGEGKGFDSQEWAEARLEEFKESGAVTFPSGRVVAFGPQDIVRMLQFMLSRQRKARPRILNRPEDYLLRKTTGEPQ